MVDKKEVIAGIDICLHRFRCGEDCPYYPYDTERTRGCMEQLRGDALALLKKQEAMPVVDIADTIDGIEVGRCPSCDRAIANKKSDPTRYCKFCGQAVKWDG